MIDIFRSGGVVMWPLVVLAGGVLATIVRALNSAARRDVEICKQHNTTILFWGTIAAVVGLLGTVVGLVDMARTITSAGPVGESLLWGGLAASLVSLVFGLLTFLVAALAWYLLGRPTTASAAHDP